MTNPVAENEQHRWRDISFAIAGAGVMGLVVLGIPLYALLVWSRVIRNSQPFPAGLRTGAYCGAATVLATAAAIAWVVVR